MNLQKRIFLFASLFFLTVFSIQAQSFDKLTQIIETPEITNGQAAYFIAAYKGIVSERASEQEAFDALKAQNYFTDKDKVSDKIMLKNLCSLFAKTLELKGGMMYSITKKSPRYAYREFVARGYISSRTNSNQKVSGVDAIGLFNSLTGN